MLCKGTCSCSSDSPSCFTLTALYVIRLLNLQPPSMCSALLYGASVKNWPCDLCSAERRGTDKGKKRGIQNLNSFVLAERDALQGKSRSAKIPLHWVSFTLLLRKFWSMEMTQCLFTWENGRQRWLNWFFWSNHMKTQIFFFFKRALISAT